MTTIVLWLLDMILIQNGIYIMGDVGPIIFLGMLVIGIWSQIYRYRNISTAIEKQQTKWVLLGITSLLFCMVVWSLLVDIFPPSTLQALFLTNTVGIAIIYLLAYFFPVSMMIATLLIAALFNPLRTRVEGGIDRRFYRRKYDAQQVLAQFAVTARDETDMNALTAELAWVVQETIQPEQVSVWLISVEGKSV